MIFSESGKGKIIIIAIFVAAVVLAAIFGFPGDFTRLFFGAAPAATPAPTVLKNRTNQKPGANFEIVAQNLQIPWEIAFLPEGDLLVTERAGTLKRIGVQGRTFKIDGIKHIGEGGLLGITLHPDFLQNRWLYLYLTTATQAGLQNRVERYRLENNSLQDKKIIIDNIPGAKYHDGGRIAFGPTLAPNGTATSKPNYYLFITTGDAGNSNLAQDINSLAGKILRLKDDGSIPRDNPFGNAIWSYGHRNPQGLTWDNQGRLWATEHGRSGLLSGLDELNLIEKGGNYGWPVIQGDEKSAGMRSPIIQSGPKETWAPAGAMYFNDTVLFTGLRGESIYQAKILKDGFANSVTTHLRGVFGRLRAIKIGPDGFIYVTTSNTDGRGKEKTGDDKIIKISPELFKF